MTVNKYFLYYLILLVLIDSISSYNQSAPYKLVRVSTSLGNIIGKEIDGVNYYLGIPYAEPPIGRYRFHPSVPKRPWFPATYQAFNFSCECLQSFLHSPDGGPKDEDCLYLNIWQPAKIPRGTLLPVLLWIYGGGFLHGAASRPYYWGDKLAKQDVIVVSFNYRVGALGFLVSTADGLFGNYGLHDQKLAMEWVQDNIRNFQGDPNKVTLFGESAGAMSVGLHFIEQQYTEQNIISSPNSGTTSPTTSTNTASDSRQRRHHHERHSYDQRNQQHHYSDHDNYEYQSSHSNNHNHNHNRQNQYNNNNKKKKKRKLFHRVILQSNPVGYKYRTVAVANFIGEAYKEQLDCEDVRCLLSEPADELIHVQDTLMAVPRSIGDFFTWGPVVTDNSYYREYRLKRSPISDVIVYQPLDALKLLKKVNIPVIIGSNADEGTVFVYSAYPGRMIKVVFQTLVFSFFRTYAPAVLRTYHRLIQTIDDNPYPDYRIALSTIIGDYLFRCPTQLMANILSNPPIQTPVYLYEFALPTRTPGLSSCDGLSCHTSEIPYVFNLLDMIVTDFAWKPPEMDVNSLLSTSMIDSSTYSSTTTTTAAADTSSSSSSTSRMNNDNNNNQRMNDEYMNIIRGTSSTQPSKTSSSLFSSYYGPPPSKYKRNNNNNNNNNNNKNRNKKQNNNNNNQYDSTNIIYNRMEDQSSFYNAMFNLPDIFGTTRSLFGTQKKHTKSEIKTSKTMEDIILIHIQVSDCISNFWTTFAKYGDPNGERSDKTNHGYMLYSEKERYKDKYGYKGNNKQVIPMKQPYWPTVSGHVPEFPATSSSSPSSVNYDNDDDSTEDREYIYDENDHIYSSNNRHDSRRRRDDTMYMRKLVPPQPHGKHNKLIYENQNIPTFMMQANDSETDEDDHSYDDNQVKRIAGEEYSELEEDEEQHQSRTGRLLDLIPQIFLTPSEDDEDDYDDYFEYNDDIFKHQEYSMYSGGSACSSTSSRSSRNQRQNMKHDVTTLHQDNNRQQIDSRSMQPHTTERQENKRRRGRIEIDFRRLLKKWFKSDQENTENTSDTNIQLIDNNSAVPDTYNSNNVDNDNHENNVPQSNYIYEDDIHVSKSVSPNENMSKVQMKVSNVEVNNEGNTDKHHENKQPFFDHFDNHMNSLNSNRKHSTITDTRHHSSPSHTTKKSSSSSQHSKSQTSLTSSSSTSSSTQVSTTRHLPYTHLKYDNNIHMMIFDEDSEINIVTSDDCVCKFWNSLEYQF